MNAGMKLIKYLLFTFNLIFVIFAFILIGIGAGVEIKYRSIAHLTGSAITSAPILLICIGVFIFFIAFFGCCGAYSESYRMMCFFAGLMVFVFILEISAAITAYSLRDKVENTFTESFEKSISEYGKDVQRPFNIVQAEFQCCGATNYTDWNNSKVVQDYGKLTTNGSEPESFIFVPDSCCLGYTVAMESDFKDCGLYANRTLYNDTCVPAVEGAFKSRIIVVGGIAVAIIFIQIVGFGFACLLMRSIKSQYDTV